MSYRFRLDIIPAGESVAAYTTSDIGAVTWLTRASNFGELNFTIPAILAGDYALGAGVRYDLYYESYGYIGRFYHIDDDLSADDLTVAVKCYDQLYALQNTSLDFNMSSNDETISTALTRILGRAGWTKTLIGSAGDYFHVTRDYQGESVFQALTALREQQRGYFVLDTTTSQIRFGKFLASVGSATPSQWITNSAGSINGNVYLRTLKIANSTGVLANRLIPLGQGLGQTQVDLSLSDLTAPTDVAYAVASRANWDGTNTDGSTPAGALTSTYYIEDTASQAVYGVIERIANFTDIRPITNSLADRENAARALHYTASAYLAQFNVPTQNYSVDCIGLSLDTRAGDIVGLDFRGVVTTVQGDRRSYVHIDMQPMYIIEIHWTFDDQTGVPSAALTLAANGEQVQEIDVMVNLLTDVKRIKLRPAPSMCLRNDSGPTRPIKSGVPYTYKLKYDASVLDLNAVKFIFQITPLVSYAQNSTGSSSTSSSSSGGAQTSSSGGGGTSGGDGGQTSSSGGSATITSDASPDVTAEMSSEAYTLSGGGSKVFPWAATAADGIVATTSVASDAGGVKSPDTGTIYYSGNDYAFPQHQHYGNSHSHNGGSHTHALAKHYHDYDLISHTHSVTITSHTHTVPSHQHSVPAHTHDVSSHTHTIDHTHAITFGVVEDTDYPTTVSVWLDGTQITPIKNYDNGTFAGNTISAVGTYYVSFIDALQGMADWRGSHDVEIRCTGGKGLVFAKTAERLTIQPIQITGDD